MSDGVLFMSLTRGDRVGIGDDTYVVERNPLYFKRVSKYSMELRSESTNKVRTYTTDTDLTRVNKIS